MPEWLSGGLLGVITTVLGALAWLALLAQIPLTFVALRLDYELRWYMLSDRALRIREGVMRVREQTMTFANIQQISVRQGPLQRLLGIADIEVRTAGGGSTSQEGGHDMHRGYLRGVADPESIRDTIQRRVREYRDAGLGGGEQRTGRAGGQGGPAASGEAAAAALPEDTGVIQAAREVLAEVRALREELRAEGAA